MKQYLEVYLKSRPVFLSFLRAKEIDLYQNYLPLIQGPILDFGCGDGFFAKTAFGEVGVGLDVDSEILAEAKKESVYQELILFEGKKIPFRDHYFQTVVSNCVLEHVSNLEGALREIHRVLKPGGYFLTTVMADNWEKYIFRKKWMRQKQKHHHLLSAENWQKVFKKAGFKIIKTHGYLDKTASHWLELLHYLSIDSLISYKLFHRWKMFPSFWLPKSKLIKIFGKEAPTEKSAALFMIMEK